MKILTRIILISLFLLQTQKNSHPQNYNHSKLNGIDNSCFLLLTSLTEYWDFGQWNEVSLNTFNYNPFCKITIHLVQQKPTPSAQWENLKRITYDYNDSGNLFEVLGENWNGYIWENSWKYNNFYTIQNRRNLEMSYFWDGYFWVKNDSVTITYTPFDSLNNKHTYHWYNPGWNKSTWDIYSYNLSGFLTEHLNKIWIDNLSDWENDWRYVYTYDTSENLVNLISQNWDITHWINSLKDSLVYDINGLVIEKFKFIWSNYSWKELIKHSYTYNWYGLIEEDLQFKWNGSDWVSDQKTTYNWIIVDVEGQETIVEEYKLLQNYPNPFNPKTTIKYQLPKKGIVILLITDLLGKKIATLINEYKQAGAYELEFDASDLPSGIYFYQIITDTFVETKKMILLK